MCLVPRFSAELVGRYEALEDALFIRIPPEEEAQMALSAIVQSVNEGYSFVVDVDLKSYFDTISHELLLELVERRVGDIQILRLIRPWLKAGVMEDGPTTISTETVSGW